MPLRDHFQPPFTKMFAWNEFHGGWPSGVVRELNKSLPMQYRAAPLIHFAGRTLDSFAPVDGGDEDAVWIPAEPSLAVETDMADFDEIEVRAYDTTRNQRLVAAIEFITPGNKDRPENRGQMRRAFAKGRLGRAVGHCDKAQSQSLRWLARSDWPV